MGDSSSDVDLDVAVDFDVDGDVDFDPAAVVGGDAGGSPGPVESNFNTGTSMGRLVLNVLHSFAQFEREMIAERTRD